MPDNGATKAGRLLSEGRLTAIEVTRDYVRGRVRGDSAEMYVASPPADHLPLSASATSPRGTAETQISAGPHRTHRTALGTTAQIPGGPRDP